MIEINDIASSVGAGFLNWGVYDCVDGKGVKRGVLKLAVAVAAIAVRVGMSPQPPEFILRDLQILGVTTAVCSVISAIGDQYGGRLGRAALKLGVAVGAVTGLQLTVFPKEEVMSNLLTFTKFGGYVSAAILSIWSAQQLYKGYRGNDVDLLKGGIETGVLIVPSLGASLGIRAIGY